MDRQYRFEEWAEEKGFWLDQIFMGTDGFPDNPYKDDDTRLAYEIWCAAIDSYEND